MIKKSSILGITLLILLLTATFAPIVSLRVPVCHASGSPWDDDDSDGIPNYIDKPEFNVSSLERGNVSLFGISGFEVSAYLINSSGVGDYKYTLSSLGILDVYDYDVTVPSIVELKLPFTNEEFVNFLSEYHLLRPNDYLPSVLEAFNQINCSDGRIRGLVTFQYVQIDADTSKIQTRESFFNASNPTAFASPGDTNNYLTISPNFTIGDQTNPQPSKTTKAGSAILTIIEWIENLIDYIRGKKNWRDIAKKLAAKLITKATQWVINFIAGIIGGPAAQFVVQVIKILLSGKGICVLLDALKKLLAKLGLGLPWWFPDPPTSEGNIDLHLYDPTGTHLLGIDYSTNTTGFSFSHGIYSGDVYYIEVMLVSREILESERLKILAINKGNSSSSYGIIVEDPVRDRIIIGPGQLEIEESVETSLYLGLDGNIKCIQIWMEAYFNPWVNPVPPQPVEALISLKDENGTSIPDASVMIEITNGVQMFVFDASNLGGGNYRALIGTSDMSGSYYMAVYPELDGYLPDNKYCTLLTEFLKRGPRKDLNVLWYSSPDAAFNALQKDEIDFIQSINLTEAQKDAVEADASLQISAYAENGYAVWRKQLVGIVNEVGHGLENEYTFLNAYRVDCQPTRMGVLSGPERLNVLYSQCPYEYAFLDRIYTHLISTNPYDLVIDQPWATQDWEAGTWFDPRDGYEKAKVTFWLRKVVGIVAPVTGVFAGYYGARDVEFTIWYTYSYDDCWQWHNVMDVHHTRIIDDYTIEVYFDDLEDPWSMIYAVGKQMSLLGPEDKLIDKLCETASVTFDAASIVNNEYQFTTDAVVQVISADVDGTPIYEDMDYYIRAGYDLFSRNVFVDLTGFTPGQMIKINYHRAIPDGAEGFYLGGNLGLDWTDTMYSLGTHYPVAIEPYVGGYALLNKNLDFFLDTPLLGEIDWKWTWTGTTRPRSGYYQINLYDAVRLLVAYCSRGDGVLNPNYFPGADIDAYDLGHIGLYDAVTLLGKYGTKWGKPP